MGAKLTIEKQYEGIEDVKDEYTRKVLYIQLIHKHFPKSYEALLGHNIIVHPFHEGEELLTLKSQEANKND